MADTSPNRIMPGTVHSDEHVAPVTRELHELIMLERRLADADSDSRLYRLLVTILDREIPYARNIRRPAGPKEDPAVRQWVTDRAKVEEILNQFLGRPKPVMPLPRFVLVPGSATKYKVMLAHDNDIGTLEADDIPNAMPSLLTPYRENAFADAIPPVRKDHIEVRTILDRWNLWKITTEVALVLSDWTQDDGAKYFPERSTTATPEPAYPFGKPDAPRSGDSESDEDEDTEFDFMREPGDDPP